MSPTRGRKAEPTKRAAYQPGAARLGIGPRHRGQDLSTKRPTTDPLSSHGLAIQAGARWISVDDALARVLAGVTALERETVPLIESLNRVLAADLVAEGDTPPFRNSAMDGYAVRAEDLRGATAERPVVLTIVADAPAGYASSGVVGAGTAIRIMTGAPLPPGADTVVRFEDTDERVASGRALPAGGKSAPRTIGIRVSQDPWVNVREAGEDIARGTTVLRSGTLVRPVEVGLLASLGQSTVTVYRQPVVAIVATGDEVVPPGGRMGPGQIRDSNSYTVAALVRRYGGIPRLLGVARDRVDELTARLLAARSADVIISSGGVSVGDYDMVKGVLQAEGEIDLWQVRMKPGKPLAFGRLGRRPFLGLPGNPVAAYVSFELFARPLLLRQQGLLDVAKPLLPARLSTPLENKGGRQHYVRATISVGANGASVAPTGDQGSGVLTALAKCNGLLVVPDGVTGLEAGAVVEVILLHSDQCSAIPLAVDAPSPTP